MVGRNCVKVLGLICLVLPFTGCTNTSVGTIQVSPSSDSITVGQTLQLSATGIVSHGNHPPSDQDITDLVAWTTSNVGVASVSSTGMVTAVAAGSTVITASLAGATAGTTAITVTTTGGGGTGGSLVSLAIIPGTQSVSAPGQTTQFIAIGTTSSGATEDVTSTSAWASSSTNIATVTSGGLATAVSAGSVTITAIATNSNGTVVTGTAAFTVSGGNSEPLTALSITPGSQSVSASGQTGQFIALGTAGSSGLEEDVTNSPSITWSSSIPTIATISSSGLVTGVSAGTSSITALWSNPDNSVVSATATVTVTSTPPPEPLLSLTIIPNTITVGNLEDTGNFLAIGTFSTSPFVRDLTNSVAWLSSAPNVFPVDTNSTPANPEAPGGLVTAYGNGSATIIAEATDPTTGSIQTATAQFNCPLVLPDPNSDPPNPGSCYTGSQVPGLLVTLTIYNEGLNQTNWLVTAPSATGTQDVVHCGPGWALGGGVGGSVCTATYPVGSTIKLTATQPTATTGTFGGWSYNCFPTAAVTAAGPNSCTITLGEFDAATGTWATSNVTVGAIFN